MRVLIGLLTLGFFVQITSCNGSGSAGNSSKIDTTSFLKSQNMIMSPFSTIPVNGSMIVPGTSVYFPILDMKAGSKLIIPSSYDSCVIIIGKGSFDANTEIIADGENGSNGVKPPNDPWNTGFWQAGVGQHGAKGVNGTDGTMGVSAVSKVHIQIGLVKLLTLNIHGNGGNGGNGGDGGTGQIGGNKQGPFGSNGDGGEGGNAGSGMRAGRGSNIIVEIWDENGSIDIPTTMQHLSVIANGGIGGKAGQPGLGREAGNNSGLHGGSGKEGSSGLGGFNGPTKIAVITKPPLP